MKKFMTIALGLVVALSISTYAYAQPKKQINLNAENIRKASEAIKRNDALFKNKDMMERYQRLAKALSKRNK